MSALRRPDGTLVRIADTAADDGPALAVSPAQAVAIAVLGALSWLPVLAAIDYWS